MSVVGLKVNNTGGLVIVVLVLDVEYSVVEIGYMIHTLIDFIFTLSSFDFEYRLAQPVNSSTMAQNATREQSRKSPIRISSCPQIIQLSDDGPDY